MALKDLVSDLSNFKGRSQYDKLDDQIKNGVDFIPNTDAPGFTPKTDLKSLFNKVSEGTFGPIGGNAPKYSSLLAGERTSQFSFPETKGATNIYINPEGFSGLQTTLNLPRELFRFASMGPENDIFKSSFAPFGFTSSKFINRIDLFHRYENSDFTNSPINVTVNNQFPNLSLGLGGSFRQVADPVNLAHPIILRPIGSNWKNANSDLQVPDLTFKARQSIFDNKLNVEGLSLGTLSSRNIADNSRIERFLLTPQGVSFLQKQHSLQRLNPTIETKDFNDKSIFGVTGGLDKTSLPIFHPERHIGGFVTRYENILNLTGFNPEPGINFTGGSRLAYQAKAFSVDVPQIPRITGGGFLGGLANLAIGALNTAVSTGVASIEIGLSSPNRYSPFPSAAPISTKLGFVAFGTPTAQVLVDTYFALNKKGGTFNKDTAKSDKGGIRKHHTSDYSRLVEELNYENSGRNGGEWDNSSQLLKDRQLRMLGDMEINDGIGFQGSPSSVISVRNDEKLGFVKGDKKSSNVDKINIMPIIDEFDTRKTDDKDFIKFRFKDMTNNRYIIFRAILDGISDSITPEYGEEKYIGRPDKVYVYQGTDRNISFNFSIYPKTKQELPILMQKLDYLVGLCYPSYTEQEFMKTPFISLTLGDMFDEAPGILSSLSITVEDNSTWELDDGLQFPHFIKAACEFKYIGSSKLSTSGRHYDLPVSYREPLPQSAGISAGTEVLPVSSQNNSVT